MATFLDPNINAWWLQDNEGPTRATAGPFQAGMQRAIQRDSQKIRAMEVAAENQKINMAAEQYRSKVLTDTMKGQALTELNSFISKATAEEKLTDPATQSQFWAITSKYAPFIDHQTVNGIWDNTFKTAVDRKDKAVTSQIREANQYDEWLQEANQAAAAGDLTTADRLKAKASLLAPKGFSLETYTDDQGNQQFRMTQGMAAPNGQMKPTVSTTTDVQKNQLSTENSLSLGAQLMGSITSDMIGVKGFVNDVVINQGLAQVFPELANKKVASGRTLIRLFNEKAVKSMKADSQLNRDERAHLESALPRLSVNESLESAKSKIASFMEESRDIARTNAERTGQPIQDWMLTKDEVVEKFKSGGFSKDPKKNEDTARELLKKYHYKED